MVFRNRWGRILAFSVLAFAVICSTAHAQLIFSSPTNVSNNADVSLNPQVAVSSTGTIYLVWSDNGTNGSSILFSSSSDGGATFSTPKSISNAVGNSFNPRIMVDSLGNINAVWQDSASGTPDIFFAHSTDGGATFSTPVNLSNDSAASSGQQVAADSAGNVFVVWETDSRTLGILFSRSLDAGVTFSAPQMLSTNTDGSVSPQIAVDLAGNISVVWEDDGLSSSDISFSRSQDHGGTFSAPQSLSHNVGNSNNAQIAVDLAGNINVVWQNTSPGNFDIFFARSTDGGQNFSALLNVSNSPGASRTPRIAIDLGGNINVLWADNVPPATITHIYFARSSNGGTSFSAPSNVSNDTGNSTNPWLALDSLGNINLVWEDTTPGNKDVFFSRSTDAGATFVNQNLSNNTGTSSVPRIAADKNGSLNVVWQDTTFGPSQILFSRFTSAVINHPPVADAGADQTVQATGQNGASIQLDGSKSSDPDGDTLTYAWTDQNNNTVGATAIVQLNLLPGTYTFTLTVTDPGKLNSSATTHVTVQPPPNHPPVADAGADQTVQATGQNGVSVQLNGSKSSDPDGDTLTYAWTDQNNTPVGSTAVVQLTLLPGNYTFTLTVTDPGKLSSTGMTHVTVNAPVNHPPVANAGSSQTVGCAGQNGTVITLNGSASSDPDGDTLSFVWKDSYGKVVGTTAISQVTVASGTRTFTLTVTDPGGLSSSAITQVTVQDTTPPSLSVSLSPNSLQPPNHKLIPITAAVSASDACSANVSVGLVSITSNEPDNGTGDGDQPNDIQAMNGGPVPFGTDVRSFLLRAERSGSGNGRIYTVTYSATDAAGNSTSASAFVVVGADLPDPPPTGASGGTGGGHNRDDHGKHNDKDRDKDKDHKYKGHDKDDEDHDKDRNGDH